MQLNQHVGTYLEFEEVYREPIPSLDEISRFLTSFKLSQILQILSKLNICLWKTSNDIKGNMEFQVYARNILFTKEEISDIANAFKKRQGDDHIGVIFHRHQLLMAIKLVMLGDGGGKSDLKDGLNNIGKYLLAVNYYISNNELKGPSVIKRDEVELVRQEISKLHHFTNSGLFVHNFARAIQKWVNTPKTKAGEKLSKNLTFDIEKEFQDETGLSISQYLSFGILNMFPLNNLDIHTEKPEDYMILPDLLSQTKLTKENEESIYKSISQTPAEFKLSYEDVVKNILKGKDIFANNFLPLAEKPILVLNDIGLKIVADPQYLEDRITDGPYWILLNRFIKKGEKPDEGKPRDWSKYFGQIQEEYLLDIITNCCVEIIKTEENPKDGLICDYIAICEINGDRYAVFIESKKSTMSLRSVWQSDRVQVLKELEEVKKGVEQALHTIQLFNDMKLKETSHIDSTKIKAYIPLVITDKPIIDEGLNRGMFEVEIVDPLKQQYPIPKSTNVLTMSVSDIEMLEANSQENNHEQFISFLLYRHNQINHKTYLDQKQFIQGMYISPPDPIVENMDTVWNTLYDLGLMKKNSDRLKKIFFSFMEEAKKEIFHKNS